MGGLKIPKGLSRKISQELCLKGKAKRGLLSGVSPCCNMKMGIDAVFRDG